MEPTITPLLPADFIPSSRAWVYQGSRPFSEREEKEINEQLLQFTLQWHAHARPVKGWAKLLFHRFIIIMADETEIEVSGCSTDSSARVIKSLERQYSVQFFDRLLLAFLVKDKVELVPMNQLSYAWEKGFITAETLFFNNTVGTKAELENNWLIPLKNSWLMSRIKTIAVN